MFGRSKRVDERLERIEELLVGLGHDAELLRTVLIIREPDTVTAANAYEGLRKQIVAVAQEHWQNLAQLVEIDVSINHTDDMDVIRRLVDDWLNRAGVRRIDKPETPDELSDLFEDLGGRGPVVEIRGPAYVDGATGRIIRKGRMARTRPRPSGPEGIPENSPEEEGVSGREAVDSTTAVGTDGHQSDVEALDSERSDPADTESVTEKPTVEE